MSTSHPFSDRFVLDTQEEAGLSGFLRHLGAKRHDALADSQALRAKVARCGPPPALVRSMRVDAQRIRAAAMEPVADLEQGYLLSIQEAQRLQEQEQQRQALLLPLLRRMTFAGTNVVPTYWSLLGWIDDDPDQPLALSRDSGHVILISGCQGSGKTLFSTVLGEGTLCPGEPLASATLLPGAYAFVHMDENDRLPQLLDALKENPVRADVDLLLQRLGVGPMGLPRVRLAIPHSLLTPELKWRLRPYQDLGLEVVELRFHFGQLGQPGLEAMLGAEEGTRWVRRLLDRAQAEGQAVRIASLRQFIEEADDLDVGQKRSARVRLDSYEEFEAPEGDAGLWGLYEPGWATIFYLGGPHLSRSRVAPLVVGLLNGMTLPSPRHGAFQRVIVVDEVNLLDEDKMAWRAFVRTARVVRHRGAILMLMGQDLLCVSRELFGLAGLVGIMAQRSQALFEHAREHVGALRRRGYGEVEELDPGEMLLGVSLTTDPKWQHGARLVRGRPLRCMHGGFTRPMV